MNVQHHHQHNQHQFPTQNNAYRPYEFSSKKKTPSKQAISQTGHAENVGQSPFVVGAAISPAAIIPLTYYPIPANFGTSVANGGSKKTNTRTRPKPNSTPKKPSNESHQKVVALNAVPLVWYPADAVYNPNLQRDLNPNQNQSKQHSKTKPIAKPQTSKQTNQDQAMNLAAYYGYLNHLNSKQKQPTLPKLNK